MENQHLFGLKLFSQKTYSLFISGLIQISSLVENISMQMINTARMSFSSKLRQRVGLAIDILSVLREKARVSTNIGNKIQFNLLKLSELMQISTNPAYKMLILINISYARAMYKVTSHLAQAFTFTASVIIATLLRLSLYDPQTLGTLDPLTLGDMDSVIV